MSEEVTENNVDYIEQDNSGVPKNFIIKCNSCGWSRRSSGVSVDLADLHEIVNNCSDCGKARRFQCPRCGSVSRMKRIQGNV